MIIKGIEVKQYDLSYDKIIKRTLDQSDELTVRFVNGLFGDDLPLDAKVEWLDKESVDDEYKALVADFYPRINGRMYSVEAEQDDNGDMALRVFRYALGGALRHNTAADDSRLKITFPHPCVIFLKSGANTPRRLTWEIEFFDGQSVTLRIPSIRLAELSVDEIVARGLLPIGQFYLRTFEPLTKHGIEGFAEAAAKLLTELKEAAERGTVPHHLAVEMQDTIRKTAENVIVKSNTEVDMNINADILETLPWIDYGDLFEKLEARGRTEGRAEGKTERDMEIALNAFTKWKTLDVPAIAENLKSLGIPETTVEAARKQAAAGRGERPKS
jgi:hypothetical protein